MPNHKVCKKSNYTDQARTPRGSYETVSPNPALRSLYNSIADNLQLRNRKAAAAVDRHLRVSCDSTAAALGPCGH